MGNPLGDCPAGCPVERLARRTRELAIEQAAFAVFAAEAEFNVQHLVSAVVVANLDCDGFLFILIVNSLYTEIKVAFSFLFLLITRLNWFLRLLFRALIVP